MRHAAFRPLATLIAAGPLLLGCTVPAASAPKSPPPTSLTTLAGTDLLRLVLTPEAARRLDIATALVRPDAGIGARRRFSGEVISMFGNLDTAIVRVEMPESDVKRVRRDEAAFVLPLARTSKAYRIKARPVQDPTRFGLNELPGTVYFETSGAGQDLTVLQLVFVELALSGGFERRTVIPYAAVLYDAHGKEWVYTSPEPFVFVRRPIRIDAIVGDDVILADGPPAGVAVVTIGAAELYGTEFGVGK